MIHDTSKQNNFIFYEKLYAEDEEISRLYKTIVLKIQPPYGLNESNIFEFFKFDDQNLLLRKNIDNH